MKCISFGKVNRKFLIPIIGGVIVLIHEYILKLIPKNKIALTNPFIAIIYCDIGMILAFIPYLILKYRSKKQIIISKELQDKSKLDVELIVQEDIFKKRKFNKYLFIFISALMDFGQILLVNFLYKGCVYNLWIFDIIFMNLFSYLILKTKLYKHQYFSIIILIILGFLLNIIYYYKSDDKENGLDFVPILIKFLYEIVLSLTMVIIKYNMEKNYCNPYEVCIWEGIIELILISICFVVVIKLEVTIKGVEYPKSVKDYFGDYDIYDFLVFFADILLHCIYNVFLLLTCYYFTPCHILIIWIIQELRNYFGINKDLVLNILGILTLILITCMFLIFIEIIELNFFNISYNTKNNVERRSIFESFNGNNIHLNNEQNDDDDEEEEEETDIVNASVSSLVGNP